MLRADYLSKPPVVAFLAYLGGVLSDQSWRHSYVVRATGKHWKCTSLLDAAKAYAYAIKPRVWDALFPGAPGTRKDSLTDNSRVLVELQTRLRKSWRACQEHDAVSACRLILQWGGVYDRGRKGDRNCDRLEEIRRRPGRLLTYLDRCASLLAKHDNFATPASSLDHLYCNAGFTKIYALLIDDFVIYDSRVAAALGMLVARFAATAAADTFVSCATRPGSRCVPPLLRFMRMPATDYVAKKAPHRRNPSNRDLRFPSRSTGKAGDAQHFLHNLRASWLLAEVMNLPEARLWHETAALLSIRPTRLLEAALFMVGYELAGNSPYPTHRQ